MARVECGADQVDADEEEEGGEGYDPEDLADDIESMEVVVEVCATLSQDVYFELMSG